MDYLNLYSDLNTQPDIKSNTEPNIDDELDISVHPDLKLGLKDLGLDFKAKEILKDIAKLRDKGLVKLNYILYTKKLWKSEGKF